MQKYYIIAYNAIGNKKKRKKLDDFHFNITH